MAKECLHEELAFGSGDYYVMCKGCGAMWAREGLPAANETEASKRLWEAKRVPPNAAYRERAELLVAAALAWMADSSDGPNYEEQAMASLRRRVAEFTRLASMADPPPARLDDLRSLADARSLLSDTSKGA